LNQPIKVLIVEQRDSQPFLALRVNSKHARCLTRQSVESEQDLRKAAQEFDPDLVFCADEMLRGSREAALDLLQLLSLQAAKLLIVEVADGSALRTESMMRDELPRVHDVAPAGPTPAVGTTREHAEPAPPWPTPLPAILDSNWDAVVLGDAAGWITHANSRACQLLAESAGRHLGTLLGAEYDFASKGRQLHRLGFFDAVTALPTPVHTSDLTVRILARARAREPHAALPVAAMDLSGLRLMTEAHGHAMSDTVLENIAGELRSGAVGCGMIARIGPDDIIVVLPDPSDPADATVNVRREGRLTAAPAVAVKRPVEASVGPVETSARPLEASVRPAAQPANRAPLETQASTIGAGLLNALSRQAIGVHYQPQYDLKTGRGCGLQALARWVLTNGDVIAPAVFIPVVERAGMIDTLGAHMLKSACDRAAAWRGREMEGLTVSACVSNLQITRSFTAALADILKASGVAASRLELEIAETALAANREATIRCLQQWKQMGVRIAMNISGDDGSSLGCLAKIPVDRLKLDRSLIHRMTQNQDDAGMVKALITLGAVHEIPVIAQGVETEEQLYMLLQLGCPQAQGFLLARPMSGVHALIALRKPWGNLAKSLARPNPSIAAERATR
jgi:EAL domain-containing protein (putative c-di-GMP-specific phosphodiesterase class I)/GGDEF domain-containing protein